MLDSAFDLGRSFGMIKPLNPNSEFQLGGINHVALVCSDMQKTVDFYSGVLGMPLIKSLDLPGGMGQHFFFDTGNGDCVAFFWFANAADRVPGISSPAAIPGIGEITSSVSSMNHLAFHVPAEKFDEYRQRLKDKGVRVGPVLNHDESEAQVSPTVHPGVYVLLGQGIHRGRHADRAEDRGRPAPTGCRRLTAIQLRIDQRVEDGCQLVDQLIWGELQVSGQP
jgi:catechol 2,3-dioxygenase-like lactoylglutathione lyase family enzyme